MEPYIDIHTHTYYNLENTRLLLNVFPDETEKLKLPCYFSAGLHPWHIYEASMDKNLQWVEQHSGNPSVLAIGEIGFDKTIDVSWENQAYVFERQLNISEKLYKPVILHCVKAYNEMIEYRNHVNQKIPWIFHWFNASMEIARELIRKKCYLSFGHMLFKENSKAFRIFSSLPVDAIFFETDDSGYTIQDIYNRAAVLKDIPPSSLIQQVCQNFTTCFGTL